MGWLRVYIFWGVLLLILVGCRPEINGDAAAFNPSPSAPLPTPSLANSPTPPLITFTPIPTVTPSATPTPTWTASPTTTPTPTATPTLTPSVTPTLTPGPVPLSRRCPDPAPEKPTYRRHFLAAAPWPTPDAAAAEPHFWLQRPLPGTGRFVTNGWFPYGWDAYTYLLHNGVDVVEAQGTILLAAADGTIVTAGEDYNELYGWRCDWYGHLVVIQLDSLWQGEPVFLLYGHVQNIVVEVGQRVYRGEPVAEIGKGGAALLPHLHLEIRVGHNEFGATRNPMLWFYPGDTRGVIAGRLLDPEGRPWQGVTIEAVGRSPENSTEEPVRTWSYLGDPLNLINPDEGWAENFVLADLRPGRYELFVTVQGVSYRQMVEVTAAAVSTVEIITEPYRDAAAVP
ncbi:MAG: M23 family metallopeptidase [Anaerolineae bacterium]|nr:M23 family metallopeptidase [Anaerolineae bacterium]